MQQITVNGARWQQDSDGAWLALRVKSQQTAMDVCDAMKQDKEYHKQIRRRLQSMAPKRAIAYVMSAQLPPDEAVCVIECDVKRKSYCETALLLNVSPETVKRCRRRAYQKFADEERSRT